MLRDRFLPKILPKKFNADDELQVIGGPKVGCLGPAVRCLLWNILKAKRENWLADFSALLEMSDLVMLQEAVFNAPSDSMFTQQDGFEWVMARSFKDPLSQIEHGVKTGCICTATERHFYLSPHAEPVLQTQKLLLTTLYPLKGSEKHLLVLNMHAINFVNIKKYAEQIDQIGAVLGLHSGPVILGGDFNTWNPARLAHFQRVTSEAGLVEAVMVRSSKLAHMNQHLDHLFYRGLRLESVESLESVQSSDHAPIVATLTYVPGGELNLGLQPPGR